MTREITVALPTLHADQVRAYRQPGRFKALRAGRRWGKTILLETIAADFALKGRHFGWFAPDYKISKPAYAEIKEILYPVLKSSNATDGKLTTITGGSVEVWTLENERAGRSRRYHGIAIDEAAFGNPELMEIWTNAIKPTLLDFGGIAIAASNTNGEDPDNFFWRICNQPEHGFVEFHAPTHANPNMPLRMPGESDLDYARRRQETLDALIRDNPPLVYQQEYLAEFVDWSGVAFFALDSLLVDGEPIEQPAQCDYVFATVDTATKTGRENDGTAVIFWSMSRHAPAKLVMLDYDIVQIEGALLVTWLPTVFGRLEDYARTTGARAGSIGTFIEDKSSGMVLLQQSKNNNWPAHAIDSKLTSMGKSERAISVSGYVYRGLVKFSRAAYEHIVIYKGTSRNHLRSQVIGFRVGNKDQVDDDLLDCFTYGAAIALGNSEGF